MSDARLRWAGGFLGLLVVVATLAPWLPLRDPDAQPDGLVLRRLAPLSRAELILRADGRPVYVDEWRRRSDGGIDYRRGESWRTIAADELRGREPGDWRRRPWFVLGTDSFGRDLLSRVIHGARVSVLVGVLAALLSLLAGGAVGIAAGLGGSWTDGLLMRLTDLFLAVPRLFLVLFLVALYRPSLATAVVVIGATSWMAAARIVRGEILSLRERDFVQAARGTGAPTWRVVLLHLLPAAAPPLFVEGTLRVAQAILLESALSFLGLGVPEPTATWGRLIAEGRQHLSEAWWISTLPGVAIAATVVALSLLGDALRERLTPRLASGSR